MPNPLDDFGIEPIVAAVDRSELVKHQLRDRKGRWVEMGAEAKLLSKKTGEWLNGTIDGIDGEFAIVKDIKKPDGTPVAPLGKVHYTNLEMLQEKADLDDIGEPGPHKPADATPPAPPADPPSGGGVSDPGEEPDSYGFDKPDDWTFAGQLEDPNGDESFVFNTESGNRVIARTRGSLYGETVSDPFAYAFQVYKGNTDTPFDSKHNQLDHLGTAQNQAGVPALEKKVSADPNSTEKVERYSTFISAQDQLDLESNLNALEQMLEENGITDESMEHEDLFAALFDLSDGMKSDDQIGKAQLHAQISDLREQMQKVAGNFEEGTPEAAKLSDTYKQLKKVDPEVSTTRKATIPGAPEAIDAKEIVDGTPSTPGFDPESPVFADAPAGTKVTHTQIAGGSFPNPKPTVFTKTEKGNWLPDGHTVGTNNDLTSGMLQKAYVDGRVTVGEPEPEIPAEDLVDTPPAAPVTGPVVHGATRLSSDITPDESLALEQYVLGGDHRKMNGLQRGTWPLPGGSGGYKGQTNEIAKQVNDLKGLIDRAELTEPKKLYRVVRDGADLGDTPGTITDKGFVSFSDKLENAMNFASVANPKQSAVIEIDVPAGTKALDVDGLLQIDAEDNEETEFLFNGRTFHVISDGFNEQGMRYLKVSLDPPAAATPAAPTDRTPRQSPFVSFNGKATPAEDIAVDDYATLGHEDVNDGLRGKIELSSKAQETIDGLESAFAKSTLSVDMTLYRGANGKGWAENLSPGSIIRDKGYLSTSVTPDVALGFTRSSMDYDDSLNPTAVLLELDVPAGTRAIDVGNTFEFNDGDPDDEEELLLSNNLPFVVESVQEVNDPEGGGVYLKIKAALVKDNDDGTTSPAGADNTGDGSDAQADAGGDQGTASPADGLGAGPDNGDAGAGEGAGDGTDGGVDGDTGDAGSSVDAEAEALSETAEPVKKFEVLPPEQRGQSGDGYYSKPGDPVTLWGKYGASGVMVRHVDDDGTERFLLVQRGKQLIGKNQGKWQLPGGAIEEKENDYQGAARELTEELSPPDGFLDSLSPVGEVNFQHPTGWHYNNIAADAPEQFEPNIDGTETGDAGWFTREEIAGLNLHPALAKNLDDVFAQFPATEKKQDVVDEPAVPDVAPVAASYYDFKRPPNLTPEEQSGLSLYGYSAGYRLINPFLHHDKHVFDTSIMAYRPATPQEVVKAEKAIAGMDSAFERAAELDHPVLVYRRSGPELLTSDDMTGQSFTNLAYTSTATKLTKHGYGYETKPVEWEVTLPAGTKALPGNDFENEVLLPRGGTFNVTSDTTTGGLRTVKATYVPAGSAVPDADELPVEAEVEDKGGVPEPAVTTTLAGGDPTPDEIDSLETYSGVNHMDINDGLRDGLSDLGQWQTHVDKLDGLIGRSTVDDDSVVYRGMRDTGAGYQNFMSQVVPGAVVQDRAYVSTTQDEGVAELFAKGTDGAIFAINLPAGSNAYDMHPHLPGEKEILLPRGTRLQIDSVEEMPDGKKLVSATVVQAAATPESDVTPDAPALGESVGVREIDGAEAAQLLDSVPDDGTDRHGFIRNALEVADDYGDGGVSILVDQDEDGNVLGATGLIKRTVSLEEQGLDDGDGEELNYLYVDYLGAREGTGAGSRLFDSVLQAAQDGDYDGVLLQATPSSASYWNDKQGLVSDPFDIGAEVLGLNRAQINDRLGKGKTVVDEPPAEAVTPDASDPYGEGYDYSAFVTSEDIANAPAGSMLMTGAGHTWLKGEDGVWSRPNGDNDPASFELSQKWGDGENELLTPKAAPTTQQQANDQAIDALGPADEEIDLGGGDEYPPGTPLTDVGELDKLPTGTYIEYNGLGGGKIWHKNTDDEWDDGYGNTPGADKLEEAVLSGDLKVLEYDAAPETDEPNVTTGPAPAPSGGAPAVGFKEFGTDAAGAKYVSTPDGQNIMVGTMVKSKTDGIESNVVKLENNGEYVRLAKPGGGTYGRKIKTLDVIGGAQPSGNDNPTPLSEDELNDEMDTELADFDTDVPDAPDPVHVYGSEEQQVIDAHQGYKVGDTIDKPWDELENMPEGTLIEADGLTYRNKGYGEGWEQQNSQGQGLGDMYTYPASQFGEEIDTPTLKQYGYVLTEQPGTPIQPDADFEPAVLDEPTTPGGYKLSELADWEKELLGYPTSAKSLDSAHVGASFTTTSKAWDGTDIKWTKKDDGLWHSDLWEDAPGLPSSAFEDAIKNNTIQDFNVGMPPNNPDDPFSDDFVGEPDVTFDSAGSIGPSSLPTMPFGTVGTTPDGKKYVNAPDGTPMMVGTTVVSKTDGLTGKIVTVENNGKYVKVENPNGGKPIGRSIKTLNVVDATPPAPAPDPTPDPTPAPTPDPTPAVPDAPVIGTPLSIEQLQELPEGTIIQITLGSDVPFYFKKTNDNPEMPWNLVKSDGTTGANGRDQQYFVDLNPNTISVSNGPTVRPPSSAPEVAPEALSVSVGEYVPSIEALEALPAGTVIANADGLDYTKGSTGTWFNPEIGGGPYTSTQFGQGVTHWQVQSLPDATELDLPQVGADVPSEKHLQALPQGSVIADKMTGSTFTKVDGGWANGAGTIWNENSFSDDDGGVPYTLQSLPGESPTVESYPEVGDVLTSPDQTDVLLDGSMIQNVWGTYEKKDDGWYHTEESDELKDEVIALTDIFDGGGDVTVIQANVPQAPKTSWNVGDLITTEDQLDDAPEGSTMQFTEGGAKYIKKDGGWHSIDWQTGAIHEWPMSNSTLINAMHSGGDIELTSVPGDSDAPAPELPNVDMGDNGEFMVGNIIEKDDWLQKAAKLPDGTILTDSEGDNWTKVSSTEWRLDAQNGSTDFLSNPPNNVYAPYEISKLPVLEQPVASSNGDFTVGNSFEGSDWVEVAPNLPVGTVLTDDEGDMWTKTSDDEWRLDSSSGGGTSYLHNEQPSTSYGPYEIKQLPAAQPVSATVPDTPPLTKAHELDKLPNGTVITGIDATGDQGQIYWKKSETGQWNRYWPEKDFTGKYTAWPNNIITKAGGSVTVHNPGAPAATPTPASAPVVPDVTIPGVQLVGANGVAFKKGDKVQHPQFGIGTVTTIENQGTHAKVVFDSSPTGKKQGVVGKKLTKLDPATGTPVTPTFVPSGTTATPAVTPTPDFVPEPVNYTAPTANTGNFATDPTSPQFGKPKPAAPDLTESGGVPWVPLGWFEDVSAEYQAKKGKAIQQSYYWNRLQNVINNGDEDALEKLASSTSFPVSPQLMDQAKEQIAQAKGANALAKAAHEQKMAQWVADVKEWDRANGTVPKDFVPEVQLSDQPFEGDTADWTKAHYGTPNAVNAISSVQSSSALARRGVSFAADSGDIEDLEIRAYRMIDTDGIEKMEYKFKLTAKKGDYLVQNASSYGLVSSGQIHYRNRSLDPATGLMKIDSTDQYNPGGKTYVVKDETTGVEIRFLRNTDGHTVNNAPAPHNTVYVYTPPDAGPEAIQGALDRLGVKATPADEASVRQYGENKIISILGARTDAVNLPKDPTARRKILDQVKAKYGITLADLHYAPDGNGRMKMVLSDEARDKIIDYTGITAMKHDMYDAYNVGRWEAILSGSRRGLYATNVRWSEGMGASGSSSSADMTGAGGDYIFTKPVHGTPSSNMGWGGGTLMMHPKAAARRLDIYGNHTDLAGHHKGARSTGRDTVQLMKNPGTYEIMYKHGIPVDDLWYVTVPSNVRDELLDRLKAKGITMINGIPIENFVLTSGMDIPIVDESRWSSSALPPAITV